MMVLGCGKHTSYRESSDSITIQNTFELDEAEAIFKAITDDDFDKIEEFIASGGNPNHGDDSGKTLLMYSVESLRFFMVEYFMAHGGDPDLKDGDGKSAFDRVMENSEMTSLLQGNPLSETFLNHILLQTARDMQPDLDGSYSRSIKKMKECVKRGSDVNAQDDKNNTSLIYSVKKKAHEVVDYLCSLPETDASITGERRADAMRWAKYLKDDELVEMLQGCGNI